MQMKAHKVNKVGLFEKVMIATIIAMIVAIQALSFGVYGLYSDTKYGDFVIKTSDGYYVLQNYQKTPFKIGETEYNNIVSQQKEIEHENSSFLLGTDENTEVSDENLNKVVVIGDSVYYLKESNGLIGVTKFNQKTFDYEQLAEVNKDEAYSVSYYAVTDQIDGIKDIIDSTVGSGKLDNVIYSSGYTFISVVNTDNKLDIYMYNSDENRFNLEAELNTGSLLEVYKVDSEIAIE